MKYKLLLYALVLWAGVAFGAEGTLAGVVVGAGRRIHPRCQHRPRRRPAAGRQSRHSH